MIDSAPDRPSPPSQLSLGDWQPDLAGTLPVQAMLAELAPPLNASALESVCRALYKALQLAPEPSFCLLDALWFLRDASSKLALDERLTLAHFEIWMAAQGEIDREGRLRIRAKIAGRRLPRHAYQHFFPIGLGNAYFGSHIVTAHGSPDLDTCVASFWGWLDAFAAEVGERSHTWNLPGGSISPADRLIFDQLFGRDFFALAAKSRQELTLTAIDLVDPRAIVRVRGDERVEDLNDAQTGLWVLVDQTGAYLGEWHASDAEEVHRALEPLSLALREFEDSVQSRLIAAMAGDQTIASSLAEIWRAPLLELTPLAKASARQLEFVDLALSHLFERPLDRHATPLGLREIARASNSDPFENFDRAANELSAAREKGGDAADSLQRALKALEVAISHCANWLKRLDVYVSLAGKLLGQHRGPISANAGIEEVRHHLRHRAIAAVVHRESAQSAYPLGAIDAKALNRGVLASVTQRDFCNRYETPLPPFLQVISALDHHKCDLTTSVVPTCSIADVQSCNVLLAEINLALNDRYRGLAGEQLQRQTALAAERLAREPTPAARGALRRLLATRETATEYSSPWYVHPLRESAEILTVLHAIFDDTDLLQKSTPRDVRCAMELLNRLKSLVCNSEVQLLGDEGLLEDATFAKRLAERILRHSEAYSIYSKVYAHRAANAEEAMSHCAEGRNRHWFADTKEQGGCARVGQSKLLPQNLATFHRFAGQLRARWAQGAQAVWEHAPAIDLHLHMCSTISGAEEAFRSEIAHPPEHRDEIWFWLGSGEEANGHLALFLGGFSASRAVSEQSVEFEITGDAGGELERLFRHYFPASAVSAESVERGARLAVARFRPGSLNSRKLNVTPYLPNVRSQAS